MWEIDATYIAEWFGTLDKESQYDIVAALRLLSEEGPNLRRPLVGEVVGSRFKNMKELRPASPGHSEIRILFAFDPRRKAVMLLGGDKQGRWNAWYVSAIPRADRLFQKHLDTLKGEACDQD